MIDMIKKFWFVVVIACVLVVGIGYYALDQMGSVISKKTVDGKAVVSEIDGKNYFIDDYYADLKDRYGDADLYKLFERTILSSIETTEEVAQKAKESAEATKANVAGSQGQAGMNNLEAAVKAMGYTGLDELNTLYEDMAKADQIIVDYVYANPDKYLNAYIEERKPRMVSHVLVKMDNPETPTAEEQKKIDDVNAALKEGRPFNEVAMAYSDDTGSAAQGGSIGLMDSESSLVPEFLETALALESGAVSEWVSSQYGRHIIKVDTTDPNDFIATDDLKTAFVEAITGFKKDVRYHAIWDKAQALNITFTDDSIKDRLFKYMGLDKEAE